MESMARSEEMSVKFHSGKWSYGPTDAAWEDCSSSEDPTLAGAACVITVVDNETHPDISLEEKEFTFDPIRGIATGGDVTLTYAGSGKELRVEVKTLGNIKICSPKESEGQIPSYRECDT
jgi:hypothetical protein